MRLLTALFGERSEASEAALRVAEAVFTDVSNEAGAALLASLQTGDVPDLRARPLERLADAHDSLVQARRRHRGLL
jgi:hypothetical protein